MDTNNLELSVLSLSQKHIKEVDDKEYCKIAVQLDRMTDATTSTGVSVGERVHTLADKIQEQYGGPKEGDTQSMLRDFLGRVNQWELFITSTEAGTYQVDKLPNSIDQAKRKLEYGLEHGCDLRIHSSTNKVQTWNSKHRKEAKVKADKEKIREFRIAHGLDPDAGGPTGAVTGGKKKEDMTPLQLQMSKIAEQMAELEKLKPDQVKHKLQTLEGWISEALTDAKAGIGDTVANGG